MKINAISMNNVSSLYKSKVNKVEKDKVNSLPKDSINISTTGKKLSNYFGENDLMVSDEKVNSIKKAIANKEYDVDSTLIAKSIGLYFKNKNM